MVLRVIGDHVAFLHQTVRQFGVALEAIADREKKCPATPERLSAASSNGVITGCGASSKFRATCGRIAAQMFDVVQAQNRAGRTPRHVAKPDGARAGRKRQPAPPNRARALSSWIIERRGTGISGWNL